MQVKWKAAVAALVLAVASAQAGDITVLTNAPTGSDLYGSGDYSATRSREVIRTLTTGSGGTPQEFVMGQSFTLPAASGYSLTDIYLKSASAEDFDLYDGNLEFKVFSGNDGSASLLGTFSFDVSAFGDGSTNSSEVVNNEWVQFTLDSAVSLSGGGDYSFLFFFDSADDDHKWAFRRDNNSGDGIYPDGTQWEGRNNATPPYDPADWTTDPWNNVFADSNDDFVFNVKAIVVPEPATTGLAAAFGLMLILVRRSIRK